jgi:hypothetical protein
MEFPMKKVIALSAAALAALIFSGSPQAHHSGYMYETTPVWITGTVVRFEDKNPHSITSLEGVGEDGQVRRWAVEGPGQSQLDRMGIGMEDPQIGDVVEFCAFPYKPAAELSRMWPGVDFSNRQRALDSDGSSPQFVAGHVMLLANGQKQFWEPHGTIIACMRTSDDSRQSWLDFLNANPRARDGWCEQRRRASIQSDESSRSFADELNGLIDRPCE